jgi:hypothetical protein
MAMSVPEVGKIITGDAYRDAIWNGVDNAWR